MGNCIRSCVALPCNLFSNDNNRPDFINLVDNVDHNTNDKRCFLIRLFLKNKQGNKPKKKAVLELVEDIFSPGKDNYSRLNESFVLTNNQNIPLQCLDARALLAHTTTTSTPASSIDLEWEHETLPLEMTQEPCNSSWAMVRTDPNISEANNSQSTAVEDWSRVPSADSLEWDSIQNSLHPTPLPEIDADTQALLNEIERLTEKALRETGQTLLS